MAFDFIKDRLNDRISQSQFRERVCVQSSYVDNPEKEGYIIIDGKPYLNFSSNDYLGLNRHPKINEAMLEGMNKFGAGASSSSLVTGYQYAHQALEEKLCTWLNKSHCLLFTSGFSANVALFETLGKNYQKNQPQFFLDKLSHASMIDGARASEALVKRFAHNDVNHLNKLLKSNPSNNNLIASEGVFSMDGDQADVMQLKEVAKQHDALFFLDDAHSLGVVGAQGQGSASLAEVDITMGTFGKALGTSGAFITCEKDIYEYLVNFGRHYIYSTAISPAIAWATKASIELVIQEQWRREKIMYLSDLFKSLLSSDIKVLSSQSSIHAIILGDETKTISVSQTLKNAGLWVSAIRPPTVPKGTSRLRVTICANHKENNIRYLAEKINKAII